MQRPEGSREVWEQIEATEAIEMKDEILNAECDDFFSDATRLVATIVQRVTSDRQQEVTSKLRREMEEFLCDSIRHATNMITNLEWSKVGKQQGEETFEPSLRNLGSHELDEFRAEGTAQLDDKHFGQDPFHTELDGSKSGVYAALKSPADSDVSEHTPIQAPASATPPDALEPQGIECDADHELDGTSMGRDFADPDQSFFELTEPDEDDLPPSLRRLSEDELSVAFDTPDAEFEADEFDARIADVAAIQRTAAAKADDEVDEPLAAMFAETEEFDDDVEQDAETEGDVEGAEDEGLTHAMIRDALLLLVQGGIMTPEQARAAYRKQTIS